MALSISYHLKAAFPDQLPSFKAIEVTDPITSSIASAWSEFAPGWPSSLFRILNFTISTPSLNLSTSWSHTAWNDKNDKDLISLHFISLTEMLYSQRSQLQNRTQKLRQFVGFPDWKPHTRSLIKQSQSEAHSNGYHTLSTLSNSKGFYPAIYLWL